MCYCSQFHIEKLTWSSSACDAITVGGQQPGAPRKWMESTKRPDFTCCKCCNARDRGPHELVPFLLDEEDVGIGENTLWDTAVSEKDPFAQRLAAQGYVPEQKSRPPPPKKSADREAEPWESELAELFDSENSGMPLVRANSSAVLVLSSSERGAGRIARKQEVEKIKEIRGLCAGGKLMKAFELLQQLREDTGMSQTGTTSTELTPTSRASAMKVGKTLSRNSGSPFSFSKTLSKRGTGSLRHGTDAESPPSFQTKTLSKNLSRTYSNGYSDDPKSLHRFFGCAVIQELQRTCDRLRQATQLEESSVAESFSKGDLEKDSRWSYFEASNYNFGPNHKLRLWMRQAEPSEIDMRGPQRQMLFHVHHECVPIDILDLVSLLREADLFGKEWIRNCTKLEAVKGGPDSLNCVCWNATIRTSWLWSWEDVTVQHLVVAPESQCVILFSRTPSTKAPMEESALAGYARYTSDPCTRVSYISPSERYQKCCDIRSFRREANVGLSMLLPTAIIGNYVAREFNASMDLLLKGWKSRREEYRQRIKQERSSFYTEVSKLERQMEDAPFGEIPTSSPGVELVSPLSFNWLKEE